MNEIFNFMRGGKQTISQVIKPMAKQKEFSNNTKNEAGTKRQRPALENITNQTKNSHLLSIPTKQKSAKKSKISTKDTTTTAKVTETKTNASRRNSYTSRRKRKSSILSDTVVPNFAGMDLSATPSAKAAPTEETKRTKSDDMISVETMHMETSTIELSDEMEEEDLDESSDILDVDEEDEEERERERDAKRNDKLQRQKLLQGTDQPDPATNSMVIMLSSLEEEVDSLPTGAQNIDALDENDPQWVTSYVNQIYDNLRENERKHMAMITDYLPVQKAVTTSMRGILVDWLVEVAEEYELSSETLYLSVNFLDRFLSVQIVDRRKFQLVGVACMLIASKYEEIYAPAIDEFVYISANTYKRDEILLMEVLILNTLGFDLTVATAKVFLRRFLKAAGADLTLAFLSSYLAELTLQEYGFVKYFPSLVAASAVFLALRTLGRDPWTPTLQHYTKYSLDDPTFQQCIHELYAVYVAAPNSSLKAIHEKYSDARFRKVAKIPPPVIDPQTGN